MGSEEIKLLIDLFNGVTSSARELMILYMIYTYLKVVLLFIFGLITISKIFGAIKRGIDNSTFINEIKNTMGYSGDLIQSEKMSIIHILRQYKNG